MNNSILIQIRQKKNELSHNQFCSELQRVKKQFSSSLALDFLIIDEL